MGSLGPPRRWGGGQLEARVLAPQPLAVTMTGEQFGAGQGWGHGVLPKRMADLVLRPPLQVTTAPPDPTLRTQQEL